MAASMSRSSELDAPVTHPVPDEELEPIIDDDMGALEEEPVTLDEEDMNTEEEPAELDEKTLEDGGGPLDDIPALVADEDGSAELLEDISDDALEESEVLPDE